jgi:hypothetical protein
MKNCLPKLSKFQVFILFILTMLLAVDVLIFVKKAYSSNIVLSFPSVQNKRDSMLRAFNKNAKKGKYIDSGYAYYGFTVSQKKALKEYDAKNGNAALVIHISVLKNKKNDQFATDSEVPFFYGFLYDTDFSRRNVLKHKIDKRLLVTADLHKLTDFELSFAFQKNGRAGSIMPSGFFIYTAVPVEFISAAICPACVGWRNNTTIPFYGFDPNGGAVSPGASVVDFSGCPLIFPIRNTEDSVMPLITLILRQADEYGTPGNQRSITLCAGSEQIRILRAKNVNTVFLPVASLASPFSSVSIISGADMVSSITMTQSNASLCAKNGCTLEPYVVDPGLIVEWKRNTWRCSDYELFRWDRFPGILFFDTADYNVQNDFFRRLAYYAEKTGYRGTLVSDSILKNKHGYNGHDYSADVLASFYTKAVKENFKLNEKELLLRNILTYNGIIKENKGTYEAGTGAVIAISQDSAVWLRNRLIAHEGWHGIFFTDADFRTTVTAVYAAIDQKSLAFLVGYWQTQNDLNYDQNDSYLIHNEFMAYIMQQPLSDVAVYFVHLANRGSVMRGEPQRAEYVRQNNGSAFEAAGTVLNNYAFNRWGLACGRVSLVNR